MMLADSLGVGPSKPRLGHACATSTFVWEILPRSDVGDQVEKNQARSTMKEEVLP